MPWKKCDEKTYIYGLEVLPPAFWIEKGFLVGEPMTHRVCTVTKVVRATYSAFIQLHGQHYEGPDLTVPEFKLVDPQRVADEAA